MENSKLKNQVESLEREKYYILEDKAKIEYEITLIVNLYDKE